MEDTLPPCMMPFLQRRSFSYQGARCMQLWGAHTCVQMKVCLRCAGSRSHLLGEDVFGLKGTNSTELRVPAAAVAHRVKKAKISSALLFGKLPSLFGPVSVQHLFPSLALLLCRQWQWPTKERRPEMKARSARSCPVSAHLLLPLTCSAS
eukprot:scaffold126224_cov21-Tisochrysis_lutea.AAC.1